MASIVKVMTAIVSLEAMPNGAIITISKNALDEEGDSGLLLGEKWVLPDLIQFMLTVSSNDAARAVALAQGTDPSSFVEAMNKKAADLGLGNTHFSNATGLDLNPDLAGASSSVEDIAKMISYGFLNHKDIFATTSFAETSLTSESGFIHKLKNTDDLLNSVSNILASKTGFTDLAGGNLAVVFKTPSGRILSAVVLGSTLEGRFNDIKKLIDASSKYVNDVILYSDGKNS
jgi:D-alanyl-D-alanine carboxypeptidase